MRELSDWLTSYLTYSENSESPESYHRWCGLGLLAGALQRRVYLKWGIAQVIYPNLYVILVGPSGRTRKGVAIGIAKDILRNISGVTIAPESSSGKVATIQVMRRATCNFQDPDDGLVKTQSPITVFSEELSVFMGQQDISFLGSLTDWYDSKDRWEYETVGRGREVVQGVCLTLIGGTAPEWIQSMLPYEAIGGGFTSRVIFVVEEKRRKLVPEYTMTPEIEDLGKRLIRDLEKISTLAGSVKMHPDCNDLYVQWYVRESEKADRGEFAVADPRFANYCERRATHLRKVMMLCSVSRDDSLLLLPEDFHRALIFLHDAEETMGKTFGGLGKSKTGDATETIKEYIFKMGITTRKTILQKFYRDVDARTLSEVEETLRMMGCVKIRLLTEQQDKVYEWVTEKKE